MGFRKFLRGAGRRIARFGRGVGRVFQDTTRVISDGLGQVQKVLDSPIGQVAMGALMANPKTRGFAMKARQAIDQGQSLSSLANRVSHGEKSAIEDVLKRVQSGGMMGLQG